MPNMPARQTNYMLKSLRGMRPTKMTVLLRLTGLIVSIAVVAYLATHVGKSSSRPPVVAPPVIVVAPSIPTNTKPVSTPTNLGSKYGLGGGPLVGSQSIRLGGSTFLPGRRVMLDPQFDDRSPTAISRLTPPSSPPPSPPTASMSAPLIDDFTTKSAPAMLSAAPLSRKGQGSYFSGASPTPYQTVDSIVVDSRDGHIVQPRA